MKTFPSFLLLLLAFSPCCVAQQIRSLAPELEDDPTKYLVPVRDSSTFWAASQDECFMLPFAEKMPVFKGYMKGLEKYLKEQLHYPPAAAARQITGTVFIGFTVQSDGSVAHARVLKGIGYGCDEEALRVVRAMPAWEPALQSGRPIPMPYSLPIRFRLPEPEKSRKRRFTLPLRRTFSR